MMMMHRRAAPTIDIPPWRAIFEEAGAYSLPLSGVGSPGSGGEMSPYAHHEEAFAALQGFDGYESDEGSDGGDAAIDAFSGDEFRMYEFKVRRCARGRSHDWTECPFAHPGEKARRRDPRRYHYSGTACPDFRKGSCKRGDACEYAHGVFECWLHPARYRTQPCKDGTACRRRVCFFAHTPEQLRVLPNSSSSSSCCSPRAQPDSYDGSPLRHHHHHHTSLESYFPKSLLASSSPTSPLIASISPPSDSPPVSPSASSLRRASIPSVGGPSVNEVLLSLRKLQLSKAKSVPTSWGLQISPGASFPSPGATGGDIISLPEAEPPTVERVESGRALRAKMFEKLNKEAERKPVSPDVGWVSDLVQ